MYRIAHGENGLHRNVMRLSVDHRDRLLGITPAMAANVTDRYGRERYWWSERQSKRATMAYYLISKLGTKNQGKVRKEEFRQMLWRAQDVRF
jgi:hypothetical protein